MAVADLHVYWWFWGHHGTCGTSAVGHCCSSQSFGRISDEITLYSQRVECTAGTAASRRPSGECVLNQIRPYSGERPQGEIPQSSFVRL
jgi:hypothetical protein